MMWVSILCGKPPHPNDLRKDCVDQSSYPNSIHKPSPHEHPLKGAMMTDGLWLGCKADQRVMYAGVAMASLPVERAVCRAIEIMFKSCSSSISSSSSSSSSYYYCSCGCDDGGGSNRGSCWAAEGLVVRTTLSE